MVFVVWRVSLGARRGNSNARRFLSIFFTLTILLVAVLQFAEQQFWPLATLGAVLWCADMVALRLPASNTFFAQSAVRRLDRLKQIGERLVAARTSQ